MWEVLLLFLEPLRIRFFMCIFDVLSETFQSVTLNITWNFDVFHDPGALAKVLSPFKIKKIKNVAN